MCCRPDYSASWGNPETKPAYLSDAFFPYKRACWTVIAEKCLKLAMWLAFKCVCRVTSDQGSVFLEAAVTQLRLCKYKLQWDALSPVYMQWSIPQQSHLILGIEPSEHTSLVPCDCVAVAECCAFVLGGCVGVHGRKPFAKWTLSDLLLVLPLNFYPFLHMKCLRMGVSTQVCRNMCRNG